MRCFTLCALALGMSFVVSCARASDPQTPRGLWLLPRKDAQNTARADLPGNMKKAPREVWAYGGSTGSYAFAKPVSVGGQEAFLLQVRSGMELVRPDGKKVWSRPTMGIGSVIEVIEYGKNGAALVTLGRDGFALLDAGTGKTVWNWSVPPNSYIMGYKSQRLAGSARLYVFPQNTLTGFCFEFTAATGAAKLLWQKEYPDTFWKNFGPALILADMNNDGKAEVVVAGKPGYMGVIDADTGALQYDLHYPIPGDDHLGRPYGLLQAVDLDGDGYRDLVMASCQVEEYIGIVRNEGGKALKFVWSQFVEHDFPNDDRELRPQIDSLADLDGSGKRSLVLGLYNMNGDKRWHTLVFDGMKGFSARLADLPDRYFWGCYDVDGDGRAEILTSTEKTRRPAEVTTLQIVDGRAFQDIATLEKATLTKSSRRLPEGIEFFASNARPFFLTPPDGKPGLLLRKAPSAPEELFRLENGKPAFAPFAPTPLSRVALVSQVSEKIGRLDLAIQAPKDNKPVVLASGPLVSLANGKRELILALADGTIIGGTPDLTRSGHFQNSWKIPGVHPAVWLGPQGERVVCTLDLKAANLLLQRPALGEKTNAAPVTIPLPYPAYDSPAWTRTTGTLMPFGKEAMRVFISLKRGQHALTGMLFDAQGKELWRDETNGPYPRTAAIANLPDNGGERLIVDDHGKQIFYETNGKSRLIAQGWTNVVPGRADGSKYALPIIGPFGPDGAARIVMSPGLDALEVLDTAGARLARRPYADHYEFEWCGATVGQIRGKGVWDIGMANGQGVFHCADLTTGQSRWTMNLGAKANFPINTACGDLDGDGRDNFLVGLSNGELLALDEKDGQGTILWKVVFSAGVKESILADIDGDGLVEIIVETEDGQIHILKGGR